MVRFLLHLEKLCEICKHSMIQTIKVFRNDVVLNFFQHKFKIIKMDFLAKKNEVGAIIFSMLDSSLGNWHYDKNILINFLLICAFSHPKQHLMYSPFQTKCFQYTLLNSEFDFMKKISECFVNNLVKNSKF